MTLWPSAYSTHLGVGRPRFHSSLQEQLLYFYIKELLVLDTLRLSWWGYWTQISHIPSKYQWAKQQNLIQMITAISDRLKKKKIAVWLFEGADFGTDCCERAQLQSLWLPPQVLRPWGMATFPPQRCTHHLPPSDRVVASQILTENSPQHMLPPELCLGEYLEEYQLTCSNSCQGKLKGKHCRWWHASAQPHAVVWFSLSEELYWQNSIQG